MKGFKKISLIATILVSCVAEVCFAQEESRQYRIVGIDSTENNYFIFCSSDLHLNDNGKPFLIKSDEDHCYKISQCDRSRIFCVVSPKIKGLDTNIYIDSVYEFFVSRQVNKTMNEGCDYIGHGDYIFMFPNEYICYSTQILGLMYTQNLDTLNYFSFINSQYNLFDGNMLKIWMNFAKSGLPYYEWLETRKEKALNVNLNTVADSIALYKDKNCKITNVWINAANYYEAKIKLLYKYKNMCFIQVGEGLDMVCGWTDRKYIK